MVNGKKEIDLNKLRNILKAQPLMKREVQTALNIDRQTMSKILGRIRRIEAGELLTIAEVCKIDPRELAL